MDRRPLFCIFMLLSATSEFAFGDDKTCEVKGNSIKKLEVALELLNEIKESSVCPSTKPPEKPMDCSEVLFNGHNISGVYSLWPMSRVLTTDSVKAYCDMDTEGGGWTVIQRRGNFGKPVDYFYKTWDEYKKGFGLLNEDFWLGNDVIYAFSNQKSYSVRFDLTDYNGTKAHAVYNKFWIDDEDHSYRLHISGYHGNASDSMLLHDNQKFSTKDKKNDRSKTTHCAQHNKGAWWYNNCHYVNLNGLYVKSTFNYTGIVWRGFRNFETLESTEIKIRPYNFLKQ